MRQGVSRRAVLKFGAAMAGVLALPVTYAPRIAAAVETVPRIPLIWLRGQSCGGDSEAFLQSSNPTVADLLVQTLSVDYDTSLMAGAGSTAHSSLHDRPTKYPNGYLAVIEGAIPTGGAGAYCTVSGRPLRDIAAEVCAGALGTISVGSCAFDGGASAAAGGSTGAAGAGSVITAPRLVNLPGCPVNVANLAAAIVHYFTFRQFPAVDGRGRPLSFYGGLIHNQCERRAHFEFGEFVQAWGDEAAQKGWCLYKMGCKGPQTFANCPTVKYADGASWNVLAGHGCIGCTMPGFWDAMGGAYQRLPAPVAYLPNTTGDELGLALVAGVGGLAVAHGAASIVRQRLARRARPATEPAAEIEQDAEEETEATGSATLEGAEPVPQAEQAAEPPAEPTPPGPASVEPEIEE